MGDPAGSRTNGLPGISRTPTASLWLGACSYLQDSPLGLTLFGCDYALLRRVCQVGNAPQWGVPSVKEKAQLVALGANVRRERVRCKLSQEKLAELSDLHPRTIQKIERGDINVLATTLFRIQKVLKCPWDKLMKS